MIPGICSAGVPCAEQLAGAAVAAALGQDRRGQVADAGDAGEGLVLGAAGARVGDALPPHLGGGDPRGVHALRLGRRAGEGGCVLGRARDLHADHVLGALADQAGLVEDAAELVAQVGVAAAEHQRRRPGHRLLGVRRPAERGDRASTDPLGDVFGRQRRHRGDHPLAQQQDRGALADAIADRADGLRQGGRRNRQADQVDAGQLDVRRPLDGERVGELDAGQVLLVGPGLVHLLRPLRGARPELDIEPATGEEHRHGGAPASSPDHRRLAQRRQPAEPLPLQLDHRPDTGADRVGERRRRVLGAREGEGAPKPDLDLLRADLPAAPAPVRCRGRRPGGRPRPSPGPGDRSHASAVPGSPSGVRSPPGRCRRRRRARAPRAR